MNHLSENKIKVTFLGTSDSTPCKDRFCTSILIEIDDRVYIFDAGAPITDILVRKDFDWSKIKALFNTHAHMDHVVGLFSFYNACTCEITNTDIDFYLPEKGLVDICRMIPPLAHIKSADDRLRLHVYNDEFVFDDGYIKVKPIRNAHVGNGFHSFGFLIEANGKKIVVTGDMSNELVEKDFPTIAFEEHTDMIISECAHFSVDCLAKCIRDSKTNKFIVTHLYPYPDKIPEIEAIQDQFSCEVIIARDNDEFEL